MNVSKIVDENFKLKKQNEILLNALRKIADCKHSDTVKYIHYVDSVALDALIEVEDV